MVIIFTDLRKSLNYPLLFLSVALTVILLVKPDNTEYLSLLFSAAFSGFYIYGKKRKADYALASVIILVSSNVFYLALSNQPLSIIAVVLLSLLIGFIYKKADFFYGSVIAFVCIFLIVFLLSEITPLLFSLTEKAALFLGERGAAFGAADCVYKLFFGNRLEELVYNTGYSKSVVINGKIVSGVKNIYSADRNNKLVSSFLTGRYYQSIFLTLGISPIIIKRLNPEYRLAVITLSIFTVITGNTLLFELFILCYNPLLYLAYIAGVYLSFTVGDLLNINIGFDSIPLLTNLFNSFDKPVYFILSGLVIALIMYFLSRMILIKFDFQSAPYYPRKVKEMIKYLGGEDNIELIKKEKVFVKNPNLINILKLECEINQNVITLYDDDLELLKEYF